MEESGAKVTIRQYIGETKYLFNTSRDTVSKTVHWYLCEAESYDCKPQKEEFFEDVGFYKYHEASHLLKFGNERQMLKTAYDWYAQMKREGRW